jgi:hypothetical protein
LEDLYTACQADDPNERQMKIIQMVYHYYQGPVPPKFEGKITPAPKIDSDSPQPNC